MGSRRWTRPIAPLAAGAVAAGACLVAYLGVGRSVPPEAAAVSGNAISRAVCTGERLWLLEEDGSLAALRPDGIAPERIATRGRVLDICRSAGRLVALIAEGKQAWTLNVRTAVRWKVLASVPAHGATAVALACEADRDRVMLVTQRRLLEWDGAAVRGIALTRPVDVPLANPTLLATDDAVWVGVNAGEWGGGLQRIDPRTGAVGVIERNASGSLCGGPLNAACDRVTGVVPSPWQPGCVIASVGMVHMIPHGRIVTVCGDRVRRTFFKPLPPQPPRGTWDDGEPSSTVAFYGLTAADHAVWAIGIDGLYRFDGRGPPRFRPLPPFRNAGGYRVSFAVPGLALVMTDVNQRLSLSGSVPLMVPL